MKNFGLAFALSCLLILTSLAGCGKKHDDKSRPLAQVGSETLHERGFKASLGEEEYNAMSASERKRYLEDWVNLTLMAQEADASGLSSDPGVKQKIEYATKKAKANALIAKKMSQIQISENELFNYYRIHMGEFSGKLLEYKVQRIYLADQATALGLEQKIKAGLDFDTAVLNNSRENLRAQLGEMGFVSPGSDSLFWQKARELKEGEMACFEADGGWYLIRVKDSRQSDQDAGFEEFKPEIRERILKERQQQVYQELLRELKAKHSDIYYY